MADCTYTLCAHVFFVGRLAEHNKHFMANGMSFGPPFKSLLTQTVHNDIIYSHSGNYTNCSLNIYIVAYAPAVSASL